MQLSLLSDILGNEKTYFLDVFAQVYFDNVRKRPRLKTIDGQHIPSELKVACPKNVITGFPEGTIYKLDVRLIQKNGCQPYFITVSKKRVQRAIEFFEYNVSLQKGLTNSGCKPRKTVRFERIKK
ncbi:MAG: hypothetical protein ACOVOW_11940 [Spirosomataceae bacterium]|jgi:hypothetical protein